MEALKDSKESKEKLSEVQVPLIVFKLGSEEYGIRIEQVKEVTITPSITRMPKTPPFIKGVANIRGDIVAIMDLEERFNVRSIPNDEAEENRKNQTYTLVVERDNYTIGLVVKEVPQTLNLSQGLIDKAPSLLQDLNVNEKYIDGIGKLEGRLIIILDIYKILSFEEEKQLSENF